MDLQLEFLIVIVPPAPQLIVHVFNNIFLPLIVLLGLTPFQLPRLIKFLQGLLSLQRHAPKSPTLSRGILSSLVATRLSSVI